LETLDLGKNEIKKISSDAFGNGLFRLSYLDFDFNKISEIGKAAFEKLPNLVLIDFTENSLKTVSF
jgi:Leucine-rich repeat (LRR) protein